MVKRMEMEEEGFVPLGLETSGAAAAAAAAAGGPLGDSKGVSKLQSSVKIFYIQFVPKRSSAAYLYHWATNLISL